MKLIVSAFWITFWFLCSIVVQAEHKKPDVASSSESKPKAIDDKFDNTLPFPSPQTEQEKLFELENKLNSQLQDFDEMLLIEKNLLSEEKKMSLPESSSGGESDNNDRGNEFGESGSEQKGSADTAVQGQDGLSKEAPKNGDIRENARSKQSTGRITGRGKSADFPNDHDDDIVARQLREAAEKETDPALREKLWDEYKLYKQGNN